MPEVERKDRENVGVDMYLIILISLVHDGVPLNQHIYFINFVLARSFDTLTANHAIMKFKSVPFQLCPHTL